jgi:hypothetical protein
MAILATVLDVKVKTGTLGEHEFLQMPSPGDRVCLGEASGSLGLWRVLYTEHSPRQFDRSQAMRPIASAKVFVEWIGDVTPT